MNRLAAGAIALFLALSLACTGVFAPEPEPAPVPAPIVAPPPAPEPQVCCEMPAAVAGQPATHALVAMSACASGKFLQPSAPECAPKPVDTVEPAAVEPKAVPRPTPHAGGIHATRPLPAPSPAPAPAPKSGKAGQGTSTGAHRN